MYHVSLAVQCIYECSDKAAKMEMGRRRVRFLEDRREWRLPGFLYADDLVLCGEED